MTMHATATFEVKTWDEQPYEETADGSKLTRARVTKSFAGDIEGDATLEYLMAYPADSAVSYVGLERIVGRLGGRAGSFVLQHTGLDEGGTTTGTFTVVPGSGTGDLRGLRGEGGYTLAGHADRYPVTLDYRIESPLPD